ncbi:MAG: CPBP family intramembrane metalloprotease [Elusimicrobia bacterium]|nr:CPBP family intramembrane metalloprotease [Elusimicrobiota bacterium]
MSFPAAVLVLILPVIVYLSFAHGRLWERWERRAPALWAVYLFSLWAYQAFVSACKAPPAQFESSLIFLIYLLLPCGLLHQTRGLKPGARGAAALAALLLFWLPMEFERLPPVSLPGEAGLDLNKLLAVAAAMYFFIIDARLDGVGMVFPAAAADWRRTALEFVFCAALLVPLGFGIGFVAWNPRFGGAAYELLKPAGIFALTAVPEEFLFRGVLQNCIEKITGRRTLALVAAAAIFGLSHFNTPPIPNWKYVFLACVAGIFYGRAYRGTGSILASAAVHTLVDWLWISLFVPA